MFEYAQIDNSGRCVTVSNLSRSVDAPHMIALTANEDVHLGNIYENSEWTRPEPLPQPEPEPTPQERITELESQDLVLMEAIADLYELYLGAG